MWEQALRTPASGTTGQCTAGDCSQVSCREQLQKDLNLMNGTFSMNNLYSTIYNVSLKDKIYDYNDHKNKQKHKLYSPSNKILPKYRSSKYGSFLTQRRKRGDSCPRYDRSDKHNKGPLQLWLSYKLTVQGKWRGSLPSTTFSRDGLFSGSGSVRQDLAPKSAQPATQACGAH